ncbi:MAG: hypothetical protein H0V89_02485 [Deltaproteobacteria bacterium]|nr:hypothetical protein [Deltaproteobacteria bacterium]
MELDRWLDRQDAPEADWAPHVVRLANTGGLGRTAGILLDLPALGQPWGCATRACAPGLRAVAHRSCCADLEVGVGVEEIEGITGALEGIAAEMAGDSRWADGVPAWHRDGALRRPGRRCVFARSGPDGLACGLHRTEDTRGLPRGTLKPLPCRLFPLAIVDLGDRRLLTAVHRTTARFLGSLPATRFPCLGAGSAPLARAEVATLQQLFGVGAAERIARAVEAWSGEHAVPTLT